MEYKRIIEENQAYRENQVSRFSSPDIVDAVINENQSWKLALQSGNRIRSLCNKLSKLFQNAPTEQTVEVTFDMVLEGSVNKLLLTRDQLKVLVKDAKTRIESLDRLRDSHMSKRDALVKNIGNMLHPKVVIDDDEKNNPVISTFGEPISRPMDHVDLMLKLGWVSYDDGIAISGNRGYFLTGDGVRVNRALVNYALDFLHRRNYKLMDTPHFVNADIMQKICQLSDYEETLYELKGHDKFLIATSEQPLTAMLANKCFHDDVVRYAGVSTCYRKETGSHGKATRGLYRVHQFEKVEQFVVASADKSHEIFEEMIQTSQEFYESLGIPYRVVSVVSGGLNDSAHIKYDLEGWFAGPSSNVYRELVSCTNTTDYLSGRINTKYKDGDYVHLLNCTLCANTRTLCCLTELYQSVNYDGKLTVELPEELKKYL